MARKRNKKIKPVKALPQPTVHFYHASELDNTTEDGRPIIGRKNSWLYPRDGVGKMESGAVSNTEPKQDGKSERIVHIFDME